MFVGFGVMAALFVLAERYAKMPVAPGRLFVKWRWRNVPIMMVARCFLFFHLFATTFYLPLFLQVLGLSEINSGALVIPFLSTAAISSTLAGFFTSKYGRVVPVWLTGLVILPIGLGLMSTLNEISSIGKIIGFSIISGFGFGVGTLISTVIPQVGIPEEELSTVTAIISTSASLGGVLGVAIVGTIINNTFRSTLLTALPNFQHENLNDIGKLIHDIAVQPGNEQGFGRGSSCTVVDEFGFEECRVG
ncbi:hypothetical protein AX16_001618 [Volvariella volvacea WC 439]|nr:hypothetical protein AX16_001618 [Volvariella volvacea WC 439]